jgi:hypothetical protein
LRPCVTRLAPRWLRPCGRVLRGWRRVCYGLAAVCYAAGAACVTACGRLLRGWRRVCYGMRSGASVPLASNETKTLAADRRRRKPPEIRRLARHPPPPPSSVLRRAPTEARRMEKGTWKWGRGARDPPISGRWLRPAAVCYAAGAAWVTASGRCLAFWGANGTNVSCGP